MFSLEKILTIDTEDDKTAGMGLTDIRNFDVDSEGKIFISNPRAQENSIFIVDAEGGLISVFGRGGQGPGELQSPRELSISDQDEVFITDTGKVIIYNNTGEFLKDIRIDIDYQRIIPISGDRYLAIAVKLNDDLSQSFEVILCSSGMEELKVLDSSKIESFKTGPKVNIIPTLVHWETSNNRIFTGNTEEYEIRVFDFNGELVNTIRKEHVAVSLSEETRARYEESLERYPPELRERFFIPEVFPPFRNIAALDDKWLLVQTYEELNDGISLYDIFDSKGEFIGRTELEGYQVKFRGDRVYCLKQKESGYRELNVYQMIWDK
ncbi:6-bladed beta-propeller [Acidobacteriota bacterium]